MGPAWDRLPRFLHKLPTRPLQFGFSPGRPPTSWGGPRSSSPTMPQSQAGIIPKTAFIHDRGGTSFSESGRDLLGDLAAILPPISDHLPKLPRRKAVRLAKGCCYEAAFPGPISRELGVSPQPPTQVPAIGLIGEPRRRREKPVIGVAMVSRGSETRRRAPVTAFPDGPSGREIAEIAALSLLQLLVSCFPHPKGVS
ncbi:MAG: hypothetical protein CM15mP38_3020 [Synechococcus sp.]|nr:MAG: hypothetical protein CM15mP38_3020 [Synechococcus sp.]